MGSICIAVALPPSSGSEASPLLMVDSSSLQIELKSISQRLDTPAQALLSCPPTGRLELQELDASEGWKARGHQETLSHRAKKKERKLVKERGGGGVLGIGKMGEATPAMVELRQSSGVLPANRSPSAKQRRLVFFAAIQQQSQPSSSHPLPLTVSVVAAVLENSGEEAAVDDDLCSSVQRRHRKILK
nr:hypothetical protein Iba_chr10eCG13890 [Ipomoea batatas]